MTDETVQQICFELATRLSLGRVTPRVIGRFSNLAVALDPLPIVARIATGTALLRDTHVFAEREIAVANFVAIRGALVISPCEPPLAGPHDIGGWGVTLWKQVTILAEPPDPTESGKRLARCHDLLRDYPEKPPYFGAFDELRQLLAHPHVQQILTSQDRQLIAQQSHDIRSALEPKFRYAQMLHGDSHRKNAVQTPAGPLWTDWEDTMFAPVEWDLACLVTSARITGQDRDWAETALLAYGPHDAVALNLCIHARALFSIGWLALLSADNAGRLERLDVWLKWLRTQ